MSLPTVRAFRTFPNRVGTVCQRQKKKDLSLIRMAEWQSRFPVVRTAHMDCRGLLFEDNRESLSSRYNLTAQRDAFKGIFAFTVAARRSVLALLAFSRRALLIRDLFISRSASRKKLLIAVLHVI